MLTRWRRCSGTKGLHFADIWPAVPPHRATIPLLGNAMRIPSLTASHRDNGLAVVLVSTSQRLLSWGQIRSLCRDLTIQSHRTKPFEAFKRRVRSLSPYNTKTKDNWQKLPKFSWLSVAYRFTRYTRTVQSFITWVWFSKVNTRGALAMRRWGSTNASIRTTWRAALRIALAGFAIYQKLLPATTIYTPSNPWLGCHCPSWWPRTLMESISVYNKFALEFNAW